MMNALHLLYLIPIAVCFGFVLCAVLTVGKGVEK